MEVYKFGGASIKDVPAIKNLGRIIHTKGTENLLLVVSAMSKTTNQLEAVVNAHHLGDGKALALLQDIKEKHKQVAGALQLEDLLRQGILDDLFVEAEWLLEDPVQDAYDYLYDQIVAIGELLSSRIVAAYLNQVGIPAEWLDARDIIKTDDCYRNANIDWLRTDEKMDQLVKPLLDRGKIVLTQGFIASTLELNTITLGREGSDYTGAIFASILDAKALTVWKDVPGIMTGDPDLDPRAQLLPRLDYREALEMTYYGAKVIHPKTLKPLMDKSIPLYVRSFRDQGKEGTKVSSFPEESYPSIKVVLHQQTLLTLTTLDFTFVVEDHLNEVFQVAVANKISIHFLKNLALSLSLVVEPDHRHLENFISDLKETFAITRNEGIELCTLRHFKPADIDKVKSGRKVYIEEYSADTAQLVLGN